MAGVRHAYNGKEEWHSNSHEKRRKQYLHGYSVQSSVLQTSGRPEELPRDGKPITRVSLRSDSGDWRVSDDQASEDSKPAFTQPAGYDLNGIGGEKLKSPPNMLARGFRQEKVLMSHEGQDEKESDYDHPGETGFRYRAKMDGV